MLIEGRKYPAYQHILKENESNLILFQEYEKEIISKYGEIIKNKWYLITKEKNEKDFLNFFYKSTNDFYHKIVCRASGKHFIIDFFLLDGLGELIKNNNKSRKTFNLFKPDEVKKLKEFFKNQKSITH